MTKLHLVLIILCQFGIVSAVHGADYTGNYTLSSGNTTLTLKLKQQRNGTLTGELVGSNGYRITLNGEVADGIGEGMATDSKGQAFFEVHFEGGKLLFYLMEQNSDQGRSLYFTRVSGGVSSHGIGAGTRRSTSSRNPLAGGGSSPFSGTFSGDGVTLSLQGSGGKMNGTLLFNGSRFPVSATASGNTMRGNFSAGGNSYPFDGRLSGGVMKFSTGGTSYSLRKAGQRETQVAPPSNPLKKQTSSYRPTPQAAPAQSIAPAMNGRTISDAQAGVTFTVPSGWTAKSNAQGYILVSKTYKGLIAITANPYHNLQELQAGAGEGIVDEEAGIQLMPVSQYERIGSNGMGAIFSGQVNGQAARAYVAGLISPHPGAMGVTIIAMTSEAAYDGQYPRWAKAIAASIRFAAPQADQALMAWFSAVYWAHSGSSSSYGGISHDKTWTFCANGRFTYYSENSASVTGMYGSASSDNSQGTWTIRGNRKQGVITLTFTQPANLGVRDLRYSAVGDGQDMYFEGERFGWKSEANCQ
ncbi:MAG: hypothetical protein GXO70_02830 [Acidobacteria bacterium]|nr:hypothetical protein [Acidobacteriota bacterium]